LGRTRLYKREGAAERYNPRLWGLRRGSDAENGNPVYDLVLNFDPDIQNGGTASDGVALFDVGYYAIESTTVPIDAAIYGSPNSNNLLDETGLPGMPDVDNAPAGSSIERINWADCTSSKNLDRSRFISNLRFLGFGSYLIIAQTPPATASALGLNVIPLALS
jgi:hypothetical protein